MIKAMPGRLLIQMTPVSSDEVLAGLETLAKLGIKTVDTKHHFQHKSRKGIVVSRGKGIDPEIQVGDTIVFRGDAGFSLDYDPESTNLDESKYRWLEESDCLAKELQEEVAA